MWGERVLPLRPHRHHRDFPNAPLIFHRITNATLQRRFPFGNDLMIPVHGVLRYKHGLGIGSQRRCWHKTWYSKAVLRPTVRPCVKNNIPTFIQRTALVFEAVLVLAAEALYSTQSVLQVWEWRRDLISMSKIGNPMEEDRGHKHVLGYTFDSASRLLKAEVRLKWSLYTQLSRCAHITMPLKWSWQLEQAHAEKTNQKKTNICPLNRLLTLMKVAGELEIITAVLIF